MKEFVLNIYKVLLKIFGHQKWWPGDTRLEIIIGAILTQNTNWTNAEKAIKNLKKNGLLKLSQLRTAETSLIKNCIKPSGYYNQKTKKILNFLEFFEHNYNNSFSLMKKQNTGELREKLLKINGIGPETADSILLYALNKKIFVIDAYTKRILSRHGLIRNDAGYCETQSFITDNFLCGIKEYNEFHALLVKLGKDFCKKTNPLCKICPLCKIYKLI
ncbi:MAG: hypothetical protein ABIA63_09115 [bacterium]